MYLLRYLKMILSSYLEKGAIMDIETILCMGEDELIKKWLNRDFKGNMGELFDFIYNGEYIDIIYDFIYNYLRDMDYGMIRITLRHNKRILYKIMDIEGEADYRVEELTKLKDTISDIKIGMERLDKGSIFRGIIFDIRDAKVVKRYIDSNKELFMDIGDGTREIVMELIREYMKGGDNYFYNILDMIIQNSDIIDDSDYFLTLINGYGNDERVRRLRELFDRDIVIRNEDIFNRYGINPIHSAMVIKGADSLRADRQGRLDFTGQEVITIDGDGSRCLDDGVYLRENRNGTYTLFIFIADVPSVISYDSMVFNEARMMGETLYLADRSYAMYPERLSCDIGSLNRGVKRNAIAHIIDVDPNYDLIRKSYRMERVVIRVRDNLLYEDADRIIRGDVSSSYGKMLEKLMVMAYKWKKENKVKSAYRAIDNMVSPTGAGKKDSLYSDIYVSAIIVEEINTLVNHLTAYLFRKRNLPYLRRALVLPSMDIVEEKMSIITDGLIFNGSREKNLRNAIKIMGTSAYYTTELLGHSGTGMSDSSHSSAPYRRFSDTLNQYAIYDMYFEGNTSDSNIYKWEDILRENGKYLNERVRLNSDLSELYNRNYYRSRVRKRSDSL